MVFGYKNLLDILAEHYENLENTYYSSTKKFILETRWYVQLEQM